MATHFSSAASSSFRPLTYVSPSIYFSQRPRRLRCHGDRLRNGFVGGEGVCVIEGQIHLPPEPGHISEPRTPGPSAHSEPQRLLPQRLEEQQRPALLLQGSPKTVSHHQHCLHCLFSSLTLWFPCIGSVSHRLQLAINWITTWFLSFWCGGFWEMLYDDFLRWHRFLRWFSHELKIHVRLKATLAVCLPCVFSSLIIIVLNVFVPNYMVTGCQIEFRFIIFAPFTTGHFSFFKSCLIL